MTKMEPDTVDRAYLLAFKAHKGQNRKFSQEPYITHPARVAKNVLHFGPEYQVVGILHDVIEDSDIDHQMIATQFGEEVAAAVTAVSRQEGEDYMDFVKRAKAHPIARVVKIADIEDNLHDLPERYSNMRRRYEKALKLLKETTNAEINR
jgi:(p)ppGpp synthase/HD superfamily hydrolase